MRVNDRSQDAAGEMQRTDFPLAQLTRAPCSRGAQTLCVEKHLKEPLHTGQDGVEAVISIEQVQCTAMAL